MHADFWKERWDKNEIGFHEGRTNTFLTTHWPALDVKPGSTVFVPLCGKSRDMAWLARQGHAVLGVELSDIAVRDFFAESGLTPARTSRDGFEISAGGGIEIWCGDLFQLTPQHLSAVAAVYDRASLIAMPPAMQPDYAAKLKEIVPAPAPILLVTFDYDQSKMPGPPFATPSTQVRALYADAFDIAVLERQELRDIRPDWKARGLTRAENTAYLLRRR